MSDAQFINTFLTLATLEPPVLNNTYKKPISEIATVGVALPKLPTVFSPTLLAKNATVELQLKSIKAPKFNTTITADSSTTILQVKQQLAKEQSLAGYEFKFLLKGKVLHDSATVGDFGEKLSIMVMASVSDDVPVEQPIESVQVPEVPWAEIESVLRSKMGEAGIPILAKFKAAV